MASAPQNCFYGERGLQANLTVHNPIMLLSDTEFNIMHVEKNQLCTLLLRHRVQYEADNSDYELRKRFIEHCERRLFWWKCKKRCGCGLRSRNITVCWEKQFSEKFVRCFFDSR